jgi:hypothetical protein
MKLFKKNGITYGVIDQFNIRRLLAQYQNGNYMVYMFDDGTKVRETEEDDFIPAFSENTDVCLTKKCSQGCVFCLTEDEIIKTSDGDKRIKDITAGDIVYSFNEKTGDLELKPVIETYCRDYTGDLIEIETERGKLICTPNHKVYTKNRGYVEAGDLQLNDDILFFSI